MLSKISKTLFKSVRANQVLTTTNFPNWCHCSKSLVLLPEVSQILTKKKTPSERATLIKITGKVLIPSVCALSSLYAETNSWMLIWICGPYSLTPKEQHLQFSKAPILTNFGELPFGDIPEPLKFVRPFCKSIACQDSLTLGVRCSSAQYLIFLSIYYK